MPFVRLATGLVLRCINHDVLKETHDAWLENGSTMRSHPEPLGLPETATFRRPLVLYAVVEIFSCCVCGYTEFYAPPEKEEKRDG